MNDFQTGFVCITLILIALFTVLLADNVNTNHRRYDFYTKQNTPAMEIACTDVSNQDSAQLSICLKYFSKGQ